jgi:hypothetical protein
MALEGTLKDFSLADIFQLIGLQRKTGVLTLKGKDDVVTVSFLDGKLVSADSLQRRVENRLGNVLVKTGRVSAEDLDRALQIQKQTLQRLGTILVENAIVEKNVLREALQVQVLQTIFRLFRWKDGDYQFSQESTIEYDRDHVTPISSESILMEGARMIDEWPIIERKIRSYDMVFRKIPIRQAVEVVEDEDDADDVDFDLGPEAGAGAKVIDRGASSKSIKISRSEGFVYELLDGRMSVGEIVERSRFNEFDTVKAVYELIGRGLVEEVREQPGAEGLSGTLTQYVEEPKRALGGPLALIGLAALLVLSLVALRYNPLNVGLRRDVAARLQNTIKRSMSIGRIERIAIAAESYILTQGSYPLNLTQLVDSGLISESDTFDPWGERYRYQNRGDGYVIDGRPPHGEVDFRLLLSKTFQKQRESSTSQRSGPAVVLVD